MAGRQAKPLATAERILRPVPFCWVCLQPTRVTYHEERRISHLWGMCRYTLVVRRCRNQACGRYQVSTRPEAEGALALPHGEFGLDVVALIGQLRFIEHRSMRQIHQSLRAREVHLAARTVTDQVHRYQALLVRQVGDPAWLADQLRRQGRVVLAIDGVQPEQGQVLWVLRDVLSGTVLLARSLVGERAEDLATLVAEVSTTLPVPIVAVLSDGQRAIRSAVQTVLPEVPHHIGQIPSCPPAYAASAGRVSDKSAMLVRSQDVTDRSSYERIDAG